jgi:hypothetical protein
MVALYKREKEEGREMSEKESNQMEQKVTSQKRFSRPVRSQQRSV